LPPQQRVPFVLRYVEELNLVEVAQACGVSLATTKRRIARARQRLVRAAGRDEVLRAWLKEEDR